MKISDRKRQRARCAHTTQRGPRCITIAAQGVTLDA